MAGYNPQRTRPRPTVAADSPAPVDALLGEPEVSTETVADVISAPTTAPIPDPVPSAPYGPSAPSAAQRSRSRMILLGAIVTTGALALVMLRLRRRRPISPR